MLKIMLPIKLLKISKAYKLSLSFKTKNVTVETIKKIMKNLA